MNFLCVFVDEEFILCLKTKVLSLDLYYFRALKWHCNAIYFVFCVVIVEYVLLTICYENIIGSCKLLIYNEVFIFWLFLCYIMSSTNNLVFVCKLMDMMGLQQNITNINVLDNNSPFRLYVFIIQPLLKVSYIYSSHLAVIDNTSHTQHI